MNEYEEGLKELPEWKREAMVLGAHEDDHANDYGYGYHGRGDDLHENVQSHVRDLCVNDPNGHGPRESDHDAHGQML